MPIIAKKTGGGADFVPAPAGTHPAICVDVVDLGVLEVNWGGKQKKQHKVNIVWQIGETRDDGTPHQVRKRYTLSLHEKAALRKDLESWRGRAFEDKELEGFDIEVLIGVGAFLNVIHNVKDGSTYANVSAIMKMPKGMVPPEPRKYIRVCDRNASDASEPVGFGPSEDWSPEDSDVPF